MRRAGEVAVLLSVLGSLLVGCSNVQKGAGAGSVVGAGVGAAAVEIGKGSIGPWGGAAVGAGYGAAAGSLAADAFWKEEAQGVDAELLENAEREKAALADSVEELESALAGERDAKAALDNQLDQEKANATRLADELDIARAEADELARSREAAEKELQDLREKLEGIEVGRNEKGITLTMAAEILFESGKADLRSEGKQILERAAQVIGEYYPDNELNVEGHTDNQPIKYSGWRSNWELSCARALSVLHFMTAQGFTAEKLSATGYGMTKPVADNAKAEGRTKNRRAVIVILPKSEFARTWLDKAETKAPEPEEIEIEIEGGAEALPEVEIEAAPEKPALDEKADAVEVMPAPEIEVEVAPVAVEITP